MLRLILFVIFFIMLVRFISRLFLPDSSKKSGKFRFFYQTFKNVRDQQNQKQEQQKQTESGNVKSRLDEIEEAEYEDITEEKSDHKK